MNTHIEEIWAFGGANSKYVHLFLGESDLASGRTVCGRSVKPSARLDKWDITNKTCRAATCPVCLERAKFYFNKGE